MSIENAWLWVCVCVYRFALGVKSSSRLTKSRANAATTDRENNRVSRIWEKAGKMIVDLQLLKWLIVDMGTRWEKKKTTYTETYNLAWDENVLSYCSWEEKYKKKTILSYIHYNTVLTVCICAFVSLSIWIYCAIRMNFLTMYTMYKSTHYKPIRNYAKKKNGSAFCFVFDAVYFA